MRILSLFKPILLASGLALLASGAQTQDISPEAARTVAFQLLLDGRSDEASDLSRVLIRRDAKDRIAWLALAQAETLSGRYKPAFSAARRAWQLANTPEERYAASLVAARALQSGGSLTRAQFWLRRAANEAPNRPARAQAVGEFRRTRAANPLTTRLDFSITPSSNTNNGARSERVAGGTISGPALALSGLAYHAAFRLSYKLPSQNGPSSRIGFSLQSRSYTLSDAAKITSPASKNGDFAFQEAEVSHASFWGKNAATSLTFRAGSNWSAGALLSHFGGATVTRYAPIGQAGQLAFGAGVERIARQDNAARSATLSRVFAQWSRGYANHNRLSLGASLANSDSASVLTDHSLMSLTGRYSIANAPMGTLVDLSMSLEQRNYHQSLALFGQRQDQSVSIGVDITLKNKDYYGFAPTLGLSARKTNSTVGLYDSETLGLRLGLRSVF